MPTAYVPEFDELRPEVQRGVVGLVSFFPKLDAVGNVVASAATYTVHDPQGNQIDAGDAPINSIGTPAVSRIDIATPAIDVLDENYQVRILWRVAGQTTDQLKIVPFDVVLYPFERSGLSLNDLLRLRPEVGLTLERLGARLSPVRTAEEMASEYGYEARLELDALIRAQMQKDSVTNPQARRPHLIINRERLTRVERHLALKIIYFADCSNPEDEDDAQAAVGRHHQRASDQAWRSVGPLEYDAAEDLVPDTVETDVGRSVHTRRVQ